MTTIQWEFEAESALKAVSSAGEMTLERSDRRVVASKGSPRDVVSQFDERLERHIVSILRRTRHPIVGEESFHSFRSSAARDGKPSPEQRFDPPASPYWLVDPIDGTANFVSHMPLYAVSAGLCLGETPVVGAVSLPAAREIYFTHGDGGAYMNGKPLRAADAELKNSLVCASFSGAPGNPDRRAAHYLLFGRINDAGRGCLRLGSAAASICYAAVGRLQVAYGIGVRIWDVAGALAVARQAGCAVLYSRNAASTRADFIVGCPAAVGRVRDICAEMKVTTFSDGMRT